MAQASGREADKICVVIGVCDGVPDALRLKIAECLGDSRRPSADDLQWHEPHSVRSLPRHQRDDRRVESWCQRMISQPRPIRQMCPDKQMALIHRAIQAGKRRADNYHFSVRTLKQRIRDWPDVPGLPRVEGGRVREMQKGYTAALKEFCSVMCSSYRFRNAYAAYLQRDDERSRLDVQSCWQPDANRDAQAASRLGRG